MLLIDCYNVLRLPLPADLIGLDIGGLCRLAAQTGWPRRGPVVVVADGRPQPLGDMESPAGEVELVYSGAARTADDVIVQRVEQHPRPRSVTVVTNDRTIQTNVLSHAAKVLSSDDFVLQLAQVKRSGGRPSGGVERAGKPGAGGLAEEEVEHWLEAFDIDPHAAGDTPPRAKGSDADRQQATPEGLTDDDIDAELRDIWPPR